MPVRYLALACDYDGTLAHHGRVAPETLAALERVLASGRKLILVTGRELPELHTVLPEVALFEWVVAENGALLYHPASKREKLLAEPPPPAFVEELQARGLWPLSVGRVIVATWQPHEHVVLEVIQRQGLELQLIFNKGAVMILPAGVNKASGLAAALHEMGLSPHNVVGVGDAENDHAFLSTCECAVAVANALPTLKEKADVVTDGDHGAGVAELIDALLADDLARYEDRLGRHHLLLGTDLDGVEISIRPHSEGLLIVGTSGGGKSTLTTGLMERLAERHYQVCVIDPEGDYESFEEAIVLGDGHRPPTIDEVLQLLKSPGTQVIANLVGLAVTDRPPFFLALLSRLQQLRAQTGRPHWLVLDEAHHLLPAAWEPGLASLPQQFDNVVLITLQPGLLAPALLANLRTVVAVGQDPALAVAEFARRTGEHLPPLPAFEPEPGRGLMWQRGRGEAPFVLQIAPCRSVRRRHSRKYAQGELPPERSFYFRGPGEKLNLRAQNLILFLQLADGVDDETWLYHLQRGDYSAWFRQAIKDEALAADAADVERDTGLTPQQGRAALRAAVERHYTLPGTAALPMPGTDAEPRRTS